MANKKTKKTKQEVVNSEAEVGKARSGIPLELRLVAMVLVTVLGALLVR